MISPLEMKGPFFSSSSSSQEIADSQEVTPSNWEQKYMKPDTPTSIPTPSHYPPQLHRGNQEPNLDMQVPLFSWALQGAHKGCCSSWDLGVLWGLCPGSKVCGSASQICPEQNPLHVPVEQSTNSPSQRRQPQHGQQAWHPPEPTYVEPGSSHPESSHFPIKASNCLQSSQQFWSWV